MTSSVVIYAEVHPAFGISCYVSGCDAAGHGFKPRWLHADFSGFRVGVVGRGFLPCKCVYGTRPVRAHTPWVHLVSHDSACWLAGLGFRHT